MIFRRSLLFLPLLASALAPASRVDDLFASLTAKTYKQTTFPKLTWSDIPDLLKVSSDTTMLAELPVNPLSSQRQTECSKGVLALWLIEGIRSGGRFPSNNPLLVASGQAGALEAASEQNHAKAARAYQVWWDRYGKMPQTRAAKFNPLDGTDLHWL